MQYKMMQFNFYCIIFINLFRYDAATEPVKTDDTASFHNLNMCPNKNLNLLLIMAQTIETSMGRFAKCEN